MGSRGRENSSVRPRLNTVAYVYATAAAVPERRAKRVPVDPTECAKEEIEQIRVGSAPPGTSLLYVCCEHGNQIFLLVRVSILPFLLENRIRVSCVVVVLDGLVETVW